MRVRKRFISLILAFMLIFCSFSASMVTFAGEKSAQGNGIGGGSPSKGGKVVGGVSFRKTGYSCYVTDNSGNIVREPISFTTYGNSTEGTLKLLTRFGNRNATSMRSTPVNWWNEPPFDNDGNGNGGKIRDWLVQGTFDGGFNMLLFVGEIWGFPAAQEFLAKDQYLIIEPFMWGGVFTGRTKVGTLTGTALGWADTRSKLGASARSGLETSYSLGTLPNSCCFSMNWLGVTPPSDIRSKHDPSEISAYGYGVLACKASELFETPPPVVELTPPTTDDYLKANELNYVFPDFKPDSNDMRTADTYTDKYNMTPTSVWKKHPDGDGMEDGVKYTFSDDKIYEGKWYIIETITSSIKTKIGLTNALLYRSGAGLYFNSNDAENLKTINCGEDGTADSADRYPGYGYDLTRTTFGDNIVISEFTTRGDNQSMKDHFKNELKFAVGHDGVKSNITMTDNVEGKANNSLSDTHDFKAKVTEYYKRKPWTWVDTTYTTDANGNQVVDVEGHWDAPAADAQWEERTIDYFDDRIKYPVNHGLFKYTPYDIKTAETGKAGTILHTQGGMGGSYPKVIWASQLTSVLKIYPEVKYEGYYVSGGGVWSDPAKKDIYVEVCQESKYFV